MKLINTKKIAGTIEVKTGLHIGGAKNTMDIGGLDSPVIKTPTGVPYIPGSSLKGKIRSLLALKEGSLDFKDESTVMHKMFGYVGDKEQDAKLARVIFRDAYLDNEEFDKMFSDAVLETPYTEAKYENTIERATGKTIRGGLRQIERVPVGAKFNFEIIINQFEGDDFEEMVNKLKEGIELLENNYLGGSGTRGYGIVKFIYNE